MNPVDASVADVRALTQRARRAATQLAEFSQDQIDRVVDAVAVAARAHVEPFARLAVEETGFGVLADKIQKNRFAAETVHAFIRPMKTVGVVRRDDARRVVEIAEPFGVVAAIVPSTNPTSTAIYKILICLKARCPIIISPHPSATRSIVHVAEILSAAALAAGAPDGAIGWMPQVSLESTQALMRDRDVAVILATGGMGLVRAAYSAGKPAYGVGPGNAPCFIERTADVAKAASDILTGKNFDHGVLCSSPNSVVVERVVADQAKREFQRQGGHFLSQAEADRLAQVLVTPQRLPNPKLVGRSAAVIAAAAGFDIPKGTRVLVAELSGVGRDYPLSIEKLCPVLSWYVVNDWQEGCERCKQILRYGGMGHTMSIHSHNEAVILEFGLKKPAFRIVVNSPTTHGSIGLSTGLDPAMTLGCGGYGGNITSDNITPRHLLNIKRLAYELRPVTASAEVSPLVAAPPALPRGPRAEPVTGVSATSLSEQVAAMTGVGGGAPARVTSPQTVASFVCEDDVRQAAAQGRTILIGERTIVTPLAREVGQALRVLVQATWSAGR